MAEPLRRTIFPEVIVLDATKGIVEYVASDQTLDRDGEVILAKGFRFTNFAKSSPFIDSHDDSTIEKVLGKVVDFFVKGDRLVETVQWAIDVAENKLAQLGWKMTAAGFLNAVSVGIIPLKVLKSGSKEWGGQIAALGLKSVAEKVKRILVEQEQFELSAVVVGANPNALAIAAKSYKSGAISDADIEFLSEEHAKRGNASAAVGPDAAALALHQAREETWERLQKIIKSM